MEEKAITLLIRLNVTSYTKRHLQLITDFIESGKKDCEVLLDKLGDWSENELAITKQWLSEI